MTNVALSAMFRASPPAGYESLYFDVANKSIKGGIRKYIGRRTPDKVPSSYMDQVDYQEPLAFEFLIYVAPEKIWRSDMRRFHERFREAPQDRDYFAFLKGTDGLLHTQGPERLFIALQSLDKILRDIQSYCGNETEIVLFSDHGMNLDENKRVSMVSHLQQRGFKLTSQFSSGGSRELSLPTFGLCSYAAIYCKDKMFIPEVSSAVCELPGVDFALHQVDSVVSLESERGEATIERKETGGQISYRYLSSRNDPLELNRIIENMQTAGRINRDGFAEDRTWFEFTNDHIYPDALANIFKSLEAQRVINNADVLVSLRDGFYYGWSAFGRIVRLLATHGNALRSSSNAFMMSSHRNLPVCIRADDAQHLLRD